MGKWYGMSTCPLSLNNVIDKILRAFLEAVVGEEWHLPGHVELGY